MPVGLEDVSKVPHLVAELLRRNWSEADVKAALGGNLLRVLRGAEAVRWTLTPNTKKTLHPCPRTDLDILPFPSNKSLNSYFGRQGPKTIQLLTASLLA